MRFFKLDEQLDTGGIVLRRKGAIGIVLVFVLIIVISMMVWEYTKVEVAGYRFTKGKLEKIRSGETLCPSCEGWGSVIEICSITEGEEREHPHEYIAKVDSYVDPPYGGGEYIPHMLVRVAIMIRNKSGMISMIRQEEIPENQVTEVVFNLREFDYPCVIYDHVYNEKSLRECPVCRNPKDMEFYWDKWPENLANSTIYQECSPLE